MATVTVAAPPSVSEHLESLAEPWLRVIPWEGQPPAPESLAAAEVWVPPYAVGLTREAITRSLRGLPGLRVVQLLSAGVEPWPDLLPRGVALCAGRGIHGDSTAELAVATTLAVLRDLPRYGAQQRRRLWLRHEPVSLEGRRVLVLGAGDIGRRLAEVFAALGADVAVVGRRARDDILSPADVPALLPRTEVVLVALPLTAETAGLVDSAFLSRLPDGAIVTNVARGAVVDTEALTAEVTSGRLRAALDVTDPEPLPPGHPLWSAPGALLTPHVGGGAEGWPARANRLVTDQLERLHTGQEPAHVVSDGY